MVVPQLQGDTEVQPTTGPTVTPSDMGAANHSSPQHAPPNPSLDAHLNAADPNLRIPEVDAPPVIMSRKARGTAKVLNVQHNSFRDVDAAVPMNRFVGSREVILSNVSRHEAVQNQSEPQMGATARFLLYYQRPT